MEDRKECSSLEFHRDKQTHLKRASGSSYRGRPRQYVTRRQTAKWQHEGSKGDRRAQQFLSSNSKPESTVSALKSEKQRDGDKKKLVSLNHLLNFTVAPRDGGDFGSGLPVIRRKRKSTPAFNKEQFLQANCQFVVKLSGDYSIHLVDSDLLVAWESIEQVRLFCHQIPSCPICLYPPAVAKITRCGHVYCWSCLLHYLALSDKQWRKCPICYESIYKKDLKSVTTRSSKQYKVGDVITMWLMKRQKDGTIACPKSCSPTKSVLPTINDEVPTQFYKLLTATPEQVLEQIISIEKCDLLSLIKTLPSEEALEKCFIDCCLQELENREKEILNAKEALTLVSNFDAVATQINSNLQFPRNNSQLEEFTKDESFVEGPFEQPFSDSEDELEGVSLADSGTSICSRNSSIDSDDCIRKENGTASASPVLTESSDPNNVYFYQASDGQNLYLHPINAQCLVKEYGSLARAPLEIQARILEFEQFSMNEETRLKYRYLNHLPATCRFMLCELELKSPLVSHETIKFFTTRLQKRRQQRQRKNHKESQLKEKTTFPERGFEHKQQLSPEEFHNLLSQASSPPLPTHALQLDPTAHEFVPGVTSHNKSPPTPGAENTSVPSFAQALCKGEKRSSEARFPALKVTTPPKGPAIEIHSDEDREVVPSFQEAFVDALGEATENMKLANQGVTGKPGGSKTAKKGRKKMVLFSTGMQRRSN